MSNADSGRVVIFLDIDGVLVQVSPMMFGGGDIDSTCLQRLKTIVDEAGGKDNVTIILSSTWRHDEAKKQRLNAAFDTVGGIPHTTRGVPDGTPHPPTVVTYFKKDPQEQKLVRDRVDEIYEWMRVNEGEFPEAHIGGRWFAIDDMDLGVDERMKGRFLKTDIEEGIQSSDVAKAKAIIAALPQFAPPPPQQVVEPETTAVTPAPNGAAQPATILQEGQTYIGVVKRYNPNRGFGFITAPSNEDIFVHQSAIHHDGFRAVNLGEKVQFVYHVDPNTGRRQAIDVVQLSPYIPTNIQRHMMAELRRREHEIAISILNDKPSPNSAPLSAYHGPGIRGRSQMFASSMPLLPDGYGFRAVNGTVFFPPIQPEVQGEEEVTH